MNQDNLRVSLLKLTLVKAAVGTFELALESPGGNESPLSGYGRGPRTYSGDSQRMLTLLVQGNIF